MGAARGRPTSAKQGVVATASALRGRAGPEGRWRQRDWRRDMAWRTRTSTARITARPPRGATYRARTSRSRRLRARRTASGFPRCPHIVGSQMPRRSGPPTRPCRDRAPATRGARRPGRGVLKALAARRRTSAGGGCEVAEQRPSTLWHPGNNHGRKRRARGRGRAGIVPEEQRYGVIETTHKMGFDCGAGADVTERGGWRARGRHIFDQIREGRSAGAADPKISRTRWRPPISR